MDPSLKPEQHSKSRLESFSDAVFAFAATLIVVSFEVPEEFDALSDLLFDFIGFAISFFALVMIWRIHYCYFRRIVHIDHTIILLNMLLLFVILFYVYPLKFMSNMTIGKSKINGPDDLAELFVIYGVGSFLVFLIFSILYYYSGKKEKTEQAEVLLYWSAHFRNYVYIAFISIFLALFNVGIRYGFPGFVYMLIGPISYFHGRNYGKTKSNHSSQ